MESINRTLDAAILKPEMTFQEVAEALQVCLKFQTLTACVRPADLDQAIAACQGTTTGVCVVLGFPHGSQLSESKADEARRYIDKGVAEIDMVANIGAIRSGDWKRVEADIAAVSAVTRPAGVPLKVIFETSFLNREQTMAATEASVAAGAQFVKTSTGFASGGATDEAVTAMLEAARGRIEVKASGGIRSRAEALHFLNLGVTRLGIGYTSCAPICDEDSTAVASGNY
jgi:deoxyribose-phosphate aldolase